MTNLSYGYWVIRHFYFWRIFTIVGFKTYLKNVQQKKVFLFLSLFSRNVRNTLIQLHLLTPGSYAALTALLQQLRNLEPWPLAPKWCWFFNMSQPDSVCQVRRMDGNCNLPITSLAKVLRFCLFRPHYETQDICDSSLVSEQSYQTSVSNFEYCSYTWIGHNMCRLGNSNMSRTVCNVMNTFWILAAPSVCCTSPALQRKRKWETRPLKAESWKTSFDKLYSRHKHM